LKSVKELKKQVEQCKSIESERDSFKTQASSIRSDYDTIKQELDIKQGEVEECHRDVQSLKKSMKNLEKENISLSSEIKKIKNYDASTSSSKNEASHFNSAASSEEVSLKQLLGKFCSKIEKSNEMIDYYKNELTRREKVFEEQEIFLTNMIFNISRELIFNKFINKDEN
jgi:chromosome segregation ATPase